MKKALLVLMLLGVTTLEAKPKYRIETWVDNGQRYYLPQRKIAFEIQGEQHSEMNPFFHDSVEDFEKQLHRDEIKELFCELNNIKLIKLHSIKEAEAHFGKPRKC